LILEIKLSDLLLFIYNLLAHAETSFISVERFRHYFSVDKEDLDAKTMASIP
jgi:hypothetical protein